MSDKPILHCDNCIATTAATTTVVGQAQLACCMALLDPIDVEAKVWANMHDQY